MVVGTQHNNRKLSPKLFHELRDFIYEKSGIFFPEGKLYLLESRLSRRFHELEIDTFDEYMAYLKRVLNQKDELIKIFNLITINETYFFRYDNQLRVFSERLLPDLLKKQSDSFSQKVKIWSAGCSSGEEIYTLTMLLKENMNSFMSNGKIELLGTDISQRILTKAKEGVYRNNSFRGTMPSLYKRKYFKVNGTDAKINDDVRESVKFDYLNLNDIHRIRSHRGMDFIFCRNVLIYFDEIMKKRVVRGFYDVLNYGGYLFLGEAESLHGISSAFKVEHFPGTFVYKKE